VPTVLLSKCQEVYEGTLFPERNFYRCIPEPSLESLLKATAFCSKHNLGKTRGLVMQKLTDLFEKNPSVLVENDERIAQVLSCCMMMSFRIRCGVASKSIFLKR